MTYDEAMAVIPLARMACAEVGLDAQLTPRNWPEATPSPGGWAISWATDPTGMTRKAIALATCKVMGPDVPFKCQAHRGPGQTADCGIITAAEAVMGRLCHRART